MVTIYLVLGGSYWTIVALSTSLIGSSGKENIGTLRVPPWVWNGFGTLSSVGARRLHGVFKHLHAYSISDNV